MNFQELLKSKTFWTGLGSVGYGVYLLIQGEVETGINAVIMGLSVMFIRDAISKK